MNVGLSAAREPANAEGGNTPQTGSTLAWSESLMRDHGLQRPWGTMIQAFSMHRMSHFTSTVGNKANVFLVLL
jgi:hypothetical protein